MKKTNKRFKFVAALSAMTVISFTTGVGLLSASAADETTGEYYLLPGASVTILTGSNNESTSFSLDYTAVVDEAFYNSYLKDADSYKLGVVIAPKQDAEITVNTSQATNICYVGYNATGITATPNFDDGAYTFTASIIFNSANIVEQYNAVADPDLTKAEILQKAAELELTARPYYQIGDNAAVYEGTTVTRSVKNVLNEVNLRGKTETGVEIPSTVLNEFVGATTTMEGEYYLDSATGDLLQFSGGELKNVAVADLDSVDNYVLAGKTVSLADETNVTFALEDMPIAKGGKVRGVTLVNEEGTRNIKATMVTKVLKEEADLAVFRHDNTASFVADGYYLLGGDIACTEVCENYAAQTANAFAGTLDGCGYTISNLQVQNGGIFDVLRGATIKNVAFTDGTIHSINQNRAFLADVVENSTLENVYISMKNGAKTTAGNPGAIIATASSTNSTYKNVVLNVQALQISDLDSSSRAKGALPMFNRNMDTSNTITDTYIIGNMPYILKYDNPVLSVEIGSNILQSANLSYNTEYDIETLANAENAVLIECYNTAKKLYTAATKFVFTNTLGENVKQYSTLKEMSADANNVDSFKNDFWAVALNTPVWHTEAGKLDEIRAEAWLGEFYIEQATGELLKADATTGALKNVTTDEIGALNKAVLGSATVAVAENKNVTFTSEALSSQTIGGKVSVTLDATKILTFEATYITMAVKQPADLATAFASGNAANTGYYVLAKSLDCTDYSFAHTAKDSSQFKGTFDGRGHTISNLNVPQYGLFNRLQGTSNTDRAILKNIAFVDFTFKKWGADRCLIGHSIRYATVENVYFSFAENGGGTYAGGTAGFGGILSSGWAYQSTFTNVIINNPRSITNDTIGVFGACHKNTYSNVYLISEAAYSIVKDSTTLVMHVGTNLQTGVTLANSYVTADALTSDNVAVKELAEKADCSSITSSSDYKYGIVNFILTEGHNTYSNSATVSVAQATTDETGSHYQYFSADDMKQAGNDYSAFKNSGYWTVTEGNIPVWAK